MGGGPVWDDAGRGRRRREGHGWQGMQAAGRGEGAQGAPTTVMPFCTCALVLRAGYHPDVPFDRLWRELDGAPAAWRAAHALDDVTLVGQESVVDGDLLPSLDVGFGGEYEVLGAAGKRHKLDEKRWLATVVGEAGVRAGIRRVDCVVLWDGK